MSSRKYIPILILLGIFFGLVSIVFGTANFFKKQPSKNTDYYSIPNQSVKPTSFSRKNSDDITPTPQPTSTQNSQYQYQNKNNNFNTYFPDKFINTDSNVKFEKKDSSITFAPIDTRHQSAGKNDQNQIIYPKIFQDGNKYIDLKYTIEPNRLVEEYIISQKQTIPKLQQKVKLFNAYPVIKDNKIDFYKPTTDNFLWSIPTPFMYEQANPSVKNSGIKFNLQCENPDISIKDCRFFIFTKEITPDGQKWLNDPNRNYPVVIDPFVDGGPCWGIGGYCDSGCTQTGVTPITVYTGCSPSLCTGTYCWRVSGGSGCTNGCDKSTCDSGNYASVNSMPCTSGATTRYNCYGTCSANGSGNCKYPYDGATRYTIQTCASKYVYDHWYVCNWIAADYSYSVSGAVTKYYGNGSANCVDNSGVCYKLTSGTSYNTSGNACGSGIGGCNTGTYYDATQCSWYPGSTGSDIKIEALTIEAIKLN